MRKVCEKCFISLELDSKAYICSYECTYCERCSLNMDCICPVCSGELVARPRRVTSLK
ncbi:DUF1272 domain-containing protein [Flagellimonas flava]|uniref:DUF1272 domain-containing protein n=1 Tax=Flagellimonas flava TaxID=570519 RepID=A0A1M5Q5J8_9FLAO|nr:hypothetical protein SAMN04488116_3500 [Allomuricauda flava]